jgi:hypothetical protein
VSGEQGVGRGQRMSGQPADPAKIRELHSRTPTQKEAPALDRGLFTYDRNHSLLTPSPSRLDQ